jgi:hypothetical protein
MQELYEDWQTLRINFENGCDDFHLVRIPLYADDENQAFSESIPQFYLVGNHKTNQYLMLNVNSQRHRLVRIMKNIDEFYSICKKNTEFNVY